MHGESLRTVVINGVQALIVLHLEGGPGFETATLTTEVWLEIIGGWNLHDTPEDRRRLQDAFKSLAGAITRWPAPVQLKSYLPARLPQAALPASPYPPEQAQENLRRIKHLLADLAAVWESPNKLSRTQAKQRLQGNTQKLLDELAQEKNHADDSF